MSSDDQLSDQITEALHASEGGHPLPLDSIPDTVDDEPVSNFDVLAAEHSSCDSIGFQKSIVPVPFPSLSFNGLSKEQFKELQLTDDTLATLWELAHSNQKQFFIVNGLLMCITTTMNTVSNALVVPKQLRRDVLVAAHDGLGHGGVNVTKLSSISTLLGLRC